MLFAVPFEEDEKDPSIWFLDHNYHESMFSMFKRINGTARFKLKPLCVCKEFKYFYSMFEPNMSFCSQGACCGLVQHRSKATGK